MRRLFIIVVVLANKYRSKIIIKNDKDKNKDVKNKDNIKKISSRKSKIINKNDKKKCKNKVVDAKSYNKVRNKDRNNVNTEMNRNDIYKKVLGKSKTSNRDVES